MTPPRPDWARITAHLRRLRELLDALDELVGRPTAGQLGEDVGRRLIAERILTQLVEGAVAINSHIAAVRLDRAPADYAESFTAAAEAGAIPTDLATRLRPSAGMRNVLTHQYLDIDLERVAEAIGLASEAYRSYIRAVAAFTEGATRS